MFSGHVRDIGRVISRELPRITVELPRRVDFPALEPGSQVSLAGVRVGVRSLDERRLEFELSDETVHRSRLSDLEVGDALNVECPLVYGTPVEGHLVQGHVDAVGKVVRLDRDDHGAKVWIRPPERVLERLVPKGSITIDGVSLAIAEVSRDRFAVALVPSTLERTTLSELEVGARVNIETDLVGRYAADPERHRRRLARWIAPSPWSGVVSGAVGVEKVVEQIRRGGAAIVWDPTREVEGDVIIAAERIKPEHFTFILTQACCHPTVPCDAAVLERLEIPAMEGRGDHHGTWMYTPVDLASEPGTGVSAAQRAATVRRLAAPNAIPEDFVMPGHVFPLRARNGGLVERAGHTEATVALCRAADLAPVGVCCEVMNSDGTMAGPAELEACALEWGVPLIAISDLVTHL
ncbi:MAG: riboflavin synthase [Planctomycetota bacterium]